MKRRAKLRDNRDYDTTQLHESGHGRALTRDYSAHFFRWSFARRFITRKAHVLEIGCGADKPLSRVLVSGAVNVVNTYTGVDLNKLSQGQNKRLTFIGEFNFVERYKELLKLRPSGFDVIIHLEVIEHMRVTHGRVMLRACYACLRPGGTMLMSTPCYDGVRHAANHIHEYTVPELQTAVERAGFKVLRRFGTFMDIKHIGKATPQDSALLPAVKVLRPALEAYYDSNAISCFFAPLYPDHSRNNLWVLKKSRTRSFLTRRKEN